MVLEHENQGVIWIFEGSSGKLKRSQLSQYLTVVSPHGPHDEGNPMRPDLWQSGLTLLSGALLISLSSCGVVEKSPTCNLKGNGLRLASYTGENLGDKQISLTFLKGPSHVSEEIGHYLEEHEIHATFFVEGRKAEEEEEVLEKLVEQGHRIGSGGFSFTALKDSEEPVVEMKTADEIISHFAYGNQFWYYGEPGSIDDDTLTQLNRAGLGKYVGPIHANTGGDHFVVDEECWRRGMSVSECTHGYFDEIVHLGHGIIPFHDEDPRTVELIEELVPELIAYGFSFVRLDQIPDLRLALTANGGTPDAVKGAEVCHDYE